ncbi:MAG: hypothetical protein R2825_01500 [Saprospiraceae bacterium]
MEVPNVDVDIVADYCGPADATGAIYLEPVGMDAPINMTGGYG